MSSGAVVEKQATYDTDVAISIPIRDAPSRSLLLSRVLAALDDSMQVMSLVRRGLEAELVDELRHISAADALRLADADCGVSITIDSDRLRQRLAGLRRDRTDRERLEHFLRSGASAKLICRLFSMTGFEVRRARRLLAPDLAIGGRPRQPDEAQCEAIGQAWQELRHSGLSERERYLRLSEKFADLPIASLERVIARTLS